MKNAINWKIFSILLIAGILSAALVLPYTIALSPALTKIFSPKLVIAALVQSTVFFSVAIFLGLFLARRTGFGLPILERAINGETLAGSWKSFLKISIGAGILGGIAVILLSLLFPQTSVTFLKAEMSVATWKTLLVPFYGGIGEEILCRLFLMTLLAWALSKVCKTAEGYPTRTAVWVAILLSSVLFGLGHLGISSDLTRVNAVVVSRAILLNGVPGIMFGWLYWKKGLESAILAHFSADIVLHIITPLVALFFI